MTLRVALRRAWATAAILLLDACGGLAIPEAPQAAPPPVVAGYLAAWKAGPRGEGIAALDAGALTHVLYAFGTIDSTGRARLGDPCIDVGRCSTREDSLRVGAGNFAQLAALRARHPQLQLLIAIGGWTGSGRFSDVAATDSSRQRFAASIVDEYFGRYPGLFDGVDIDWEYPVHGGLSSNARRPEDATNFTLLLAELRRQLDALGRTDGRRYLLTAATAAGPRATLDLELAKVAVLVDWLNVMSYDYHAGERRTNFNAPLYAAMSDPTPALTVDATLRRYLDAGVPREKLVLGVPLYARVYGGVDESGDGLYQPADSAPPAPWRAAVDQRTLGRLDPAGRGFMRFRHGVARVPWMYDPATRVWITYEDAQSVREKGAFARRHALRGVMAWEILGDDGTLVPALAGAVRTDPR